MGSDSASPDATPDDGDDVDEPGAPPGVDPNRASAARVYDYILSGTNNFAADRALAEQLMSMIPGLVELAWANRGFHQRAVRWLAETGGIRQFVDLGSGLPTQNNTHQIAQRVSPDAHVVYVDIDPMVAAHAEELLEPTGNTSVLIGDLSEPDELLADPRLRRLIDFSRPVALLMTAVLHFVPDAADPWAKVARLVGALPSGSYLALSHGTTDRWHHSEVVERVQDEHRRHSSAQTYPRSKSDVERFFTGLEVLPPYEGAAPAVTYAGLWGAEDPAVADDDPARWIYAAVGRKP